MSSKKVALVTGSNKGIGFGIVRQLCLKFDGDVVLCSRDETRGKAAVAQLESEGLKPRFLQLAIDDVESVKAAKEWLVKEYGGLDILVNNAAIGYADDKIKPHIEAAREILAINVFATSSVCDILFPILRPGARVVNISSSMGMLMRFPSEGLRARLASKILTRDDIKQVADEYVRDVEAGVHEKNGWPTFYSFGSYCVSKVLLSALTWIQDREFRKDDRKDIVINSVHPGFVDTDMSEHKGILTVDEGAFAAMKCCLIPANGEPRGQMMWSNGDIVDWVNDKLDVFAHTPQNEA